MATDWTKLFKKYKGQWLALKDDEKTIIAVGKTATEAWKKSQKKGIQNPILTHMPERLVSYVGSGNEVQI